MNERSGTISPDYYDASYTDTPDIHLVDGFEFGVADDLGIANDYDSLQRQIESGKEVGRLTTKSTGPGADGAAEHAIVEAEEGVIKCGDCSNPDCPGCGGR